MSIRYAHRYTKAEIQADRRTLYVYGDNFAEQGYGGQAREARGEYNAIGIPTKRSPTMEPRAFLSDADLPTLIAKATVPLSLLRRHLEAGGDIVFPADGVGTGLAEMPTRAPLCWAWLCERLQELGIRNWTATGRDGESVG